MRVAFACDHAAAEQREPLLDALRADGHEVLDFGTDTAEAVDYPDHIIPAAGALANGEAQRAVLMCGTGIGASIVANKIPGVRCARATTVDDAEMTRRHNDTNALALGARTNDVATNIAIMRRWIETPFEGGRHQRRLDKITEIEGKSP